MQITNKNKNKKYILLQSDNKELLIDTDAFEFASLEKETMKIYFASGADIALYGDCKKQFQEMVENLLK